MGVCEAHDRKVRRQPDERRDERVRILLPRRRPDELKAVGQRIQPLAVSAGEQRPVSLERVLGESGWHDGSSRERVQDPVDVKQEQRLRPVRAVLRFRRAKHQPRRVAGVAAAGRPTVASQSGVIPEHVQLARLEGSDPQTVVRNVLETGSRTMSGDGSVIRERGRFVFKQAGRAPTRGSPREPA